MNEYIHVPSPASSLSTAEGYAGVTREEIMTFLDALTVERESFVTSTDRVLQSNDLMMMKKNGRIVALGGVTCLWHTPLVYIVVSSDYHGLGYGYRLSQAIILEFRRLYPFLLAIIMNHNRETIRLARGLGLYPCLISEKCHFLFLPLST